MCRQDQDPRAACPAVASPVHLELDRVRGILALTLARPEKKNALDPETLRLLLEGLHAARDDPDVRAVLLAAEGDVFCAGGDIQVMRASAGDAPALLARLRGGLNRVVQAIHDLPKPVVAKVQGNAYGAGAVLAFQCDLALVADAATFALSFRHVGLIPDTGGTWLLPRIVGLQRAKHLVWTGAAFSATDAVAWGLALRTVPRGGLDKATGDLLATLVDGPGSTLALAKHALHRNLGASLGDGLDREARMQAAAFLTAEHAEGRDAFFERRKPAFRRAPRQG